MAEFSIVSAYTSVALPKAAPAAIRFHATIALLSLLIVIAVVRRSRVFIGVFLLLAVWAAWQDQSRWQPSDATFERLPDPLTGYVYEDSPNVNELSIPDWSWDEFNVPHYPENRVYRNVFRRVCELTGSPPDLKLVVQGKLALRHGGQQHVYYCSSPM